MTDLDIENIEISLLLEAINRRYGYDFRGYAMASIKRRIINYLNNDDQETISDVQREILRDSSQFSSLLQNLTINVTEMFRNPSFFNMITIEIQPYL